MIKLTEKQVNAIVTAIVVILSACGWIAMEGCSVITNVQKNSNGSTQQVEQSTEIDSTGINDIINL